MQKELKDLILLQEPYKRYIIPYKIINDIKVKKIKIQKDDKRPSKFWRMFDYPYPSIVIVGATGTGKTTIIFQIIQEAIQKDTVIFIFSNTGWDDDYMAIRDYVESKGCQLYVYDSTEDDEEGNILKNIMDDYGEQKQKKDDEENEEDEIKEEKEEGPKMNFFLFDDEIKEKKKIKKQKSKWLPLNFICIFDDLPENELRSKNLYNFVKQSRHIKCLNILSMQSLFDINPKTRSQIRNYLLLDGLNEAKIKDIYSKLNLKLDFKIFYNMYNSIIKEPYNFFYIDRVKKEESIKKNSKNTKYIEPNGKFRCNFNMSLSPEAFKINSL